MGDALKGALADEALQLRNQAEALLEERVASLQFAARARIEPVVDSPRARVRAYCAEIRMRATLYTASADPRRHCADRP
jgi:hypothetical protein